MPVRKSKANCSCNVGLMLVGKAVVAVGLFILVAGLGAQLAIGLTGQNSLLTFKEVLPLYFVGLVVGAFGKILSKQSCRDCSAHGCCR